MRNIEFKKEDESRTNKIYLVLEFAGGDADTEHPEEILLPFPYSKWKNNIDEIELQVSLYRQLEEVLDDHDYRTKGMYDEVKAEYSEEVADLYDNVPGDPQNDFQYKCYISGMHLIGYTHKGTKYKAYL